MIILHVPFPPTSPLTLQNLTCCILQTTATNKQNTYLPVSLILLLPRHNPSPPPVLAVPTPRLATQVELVLCATFVVTNARASGGIRGILPGPRAAAEHQPAEAKPEPHHRAVTDPSAAIITGQGTNTAGGRFLLVTSPKTTAQSSGPAADGQLSCSAWQHSAKHKGSSITQSSRS